MRKKFHERWITIRYRLTDQRPPPLTAAQIRGMQQRLAVFLVPWHKLRHTVECKGGIKCHKRHNCRFKLPDNAFLMWLFLCDIGGTEMADPYVPYLFYNKQKPLSAINEHMKQLVATVFRWNGTRAIYDDGDKRWVLPHLRDREWAQ
jgi:hypothetical protein